MEKQQKLYEDQIASLRQHKQKCEQLLESHKRDCDKTFSIPSASATSSPSSSHHASASSGAATPVSATMTAGSSRRKQTTPKLNLDTSCSTSHRMSSSSSSGELHSPLINP